MCLLLTLLIAVSMTKVEEAEKQTQIPSLSMEYQNPPAVWQRGERASKQHLQSFSENMGTFLKKAPWKKSSHVSFQVASLNQTGTALQRQASQGHLLLVFVTIKLLVGLTLSIFVAPDLPGCSTTPARAFCTRAHPNNAFYQITQVEPNEFVSA